MMGSSRLKSTQQGTAIFMALLMIAIVTSIAVALLRSQRFDIKRTDMLITSEQSLLYAQGVVDWAVGALVADTQNPDSSVGWPLVLQPSPIDDGQGSISAVLQDAEGLFNINNFNLHIQEDTEKQSVSNPITTVNFNPNSDVTNSSQSATSAKKSKADTSQSKQEQLFSDLLSVLGVRLSRQQQQELIAAIKDWVNPRTNQARFDQIYAQRNPAYQSPHHSMASISELRMVAGITPQIYNQLLPFMVALPEKTTIKAEHAPPAIVRALGTSSKGTTTSTKIRKSSKYFLLRADVILRGQHLILYSLLKRSTDSKNPRVTILWQSFGSM